MTITQPETEVSAEFRAEHTHSSGLITPKARLNFPAIFEPKPYQNDNNPKYSCVINLDKRLGETQSFHRLWREECALLAKAALGADAFVQVPGGVEKTWKAHGCVDGDRPTEKYEENRGCWLFKGASPAKNPPHVQVVVGGGAPHFVTEDPQNEIAKSGNTGQLILRPKFTKTYLCVSLELIGVMIYLNEDPSEVVVKPLIPQAQAAEAFAKMGKRTAPALAASPPPLEGEVSTPPPVDDFSEFA